MSNWFFRLHKIIDYLIKKEKRRNFFQFIKLEHHAHIAKNIKFNSVHARWGDLLRVRGHWTLKDDHRPCAQAPE